ncbi:hypothetical protein BGZ96_000045 [Linnemannia gamsii]|uniref:Nuclear pore complex protein n=1 Tax=Linnemannia gamsii TaxID=64522 RepID=A0ABQ7KI50_9FUNG|nr:hypothetical protein BGZ96_000045 [Linnemannia gamsii]
MDILQLQNSTIRTTIADTTRAQWHGYPDFAPMLEGLPNPGDVPPTPPLYSFLDLISLTSEANDEASDKTFLQLQSYCVGADPALFAQVLARFTLEAGESYPSLSSTAKTTGWLEWVIDYKPGLLRKGEMARRLWTTAKQRGEDIDKMAIHWIVAVLAKKQELAADASRRRKQEESIGNNTQSWNMVQYQSHHDTLYMLHCGPLAQQGLPLWDSESVLNALVKLRDGTDFGAFENQVLLLTNILERIFAWLESTDSDDSIEELKSRAAIYTKVPEIMLFAMDTILKYLDGRWVKEDSKGETRSKALTISLTDINRDRQPIHYKSTGLAGSFSFQDGSYINRGKSLRGKEEPKAQGRTYPVREFEIADLAARCMSGHDPAVINQLMRRFVLHLGMRVDTAMVSATSAAMKHAAQQRDKILLRLMTETPAYRRIIVLAMEQDRRSASICLPVIQGMLRCMIAHWNACKSTSSKAYPKELEETSWLAQLAEQTGLIPDPINQAAVLFPLIDSKDVGAVLEQCYYVLLVRNAESLQTQQQPVQQVSTDNQGPEISLIRRLIFKHATRTFHLMPLFAAKAAP